ncbi:MAG: hypothetical protein ABIY70_08865 [Capsulimonas sp.]|uniref:hypothetical protein n=1 Tax=Capsulimonas sp. TaxID=2494211 RepID=UPI003263E923
MTDLDDAVEHLFLRCLQYLSRHTSEIPRFEMGWVRLYDAEEIEARRLPRQYCFEGFTAEIRYHDLWGKWIVVYNGDVPEWRRCAFLCHELFEYTAHKILADDPQLAGGYADLPHIVGQRSVERCLPAPTSHMLEDMIASGIVRLGMDRLAARDSIDTFDTGETWEQPPSLAAHMPPIVVRRTLDWPSRPNGFEKYDSHWMNGDL